MDKISKDRLTFLAPGTFMSHGEVGGNGDGWVIDHVTQSQSSMSQWKKYMYITYGWSCRKSKPLKSLFSNIITVSNTKVIPYIKQDPPMKHRRRSCLILTLTVLILTVLTFGCVTAILWAVKPNSFGGIFAKTEDPPKGTESNGISNAHDRMLSRKCKDNVTITSLTNRECGGILNFIDRKSGSSMCKTLASLVRCVYFTLWYQDNPCSVKDVKDAVIRSLSRSHPNIRAHRNLCHGVDSKLGVASVLQPNSCEVDSDLYKIGRKHCSIVMNTIEGAGATGKTICRNLISLLKCMKTAIEDSHPVCPTEIFRSNLEFGTVMFPYLTNDSLATCTGNGANPPCSGYLSDRETEVFVRCSSYLSLQSASNLSPPHCKIYASMVRCIERELARIGRSCSVKNIVGRLETDLSKVPEANPRHIRKCFNFIEDYNQTSVCEQGDVLTMIAEDFCSKPENEPFRLTKTKMPMSELFEQCSNISATITCVSEHLSTSGISCHPARVESTIIQHGGLSGLNEGGFNYSDCTALSAVKERLCTDGLSVLQITLETCNIALDFIKQEKSETFKCSYFRQFVTCAQTILQPRGYECFFNQLQDTLIKEYRQIVQRSGYDPSYCADYPANL